jgi:SAM-dependent methyltransferase
METPANFDDYSDTYSQAVNQSIAFSGLDVNFFVRAKVVRLLELLATHFGGTHCLRILDAGCGIGNYHPYLRAHVARVTGVDVSAECVARAGDRNPGVDYRVYDGKVLPYGEAIFDATFAICVLHHVRRADRDGFVAELARVTRRGGLIVVFEHNPWNPLTRRAVSNCAFDKGVQLLARSESIALLRNAGLTDVKARFILALPAIDGNLRRFDDAMGGLPFGAQYFALGSRP